MLFRAKLNVKFKGCIRRRIFLLIQSLLLERKYIIMAKSSLEFTCTECGSACRRKFAIEERDKKNAETIEEMEKMYNSVFKNPLPQLEGTEKQVKWAESIRAKIYIFAFRAFNLKSASRFILALNEYTDSTF